MNRTARRTQGCQCHFTHPDKLSRKSEAAQGSMPPPPHALRHTFAHRWLKKHPGDIRTLADILGHSDIKTTMIYLIYLFSSYPASSLSRFHAPRLPASWLPALQPPPAIGKLLADPGIVFCSTEASWGVGLSNNPTPVLASASQTQIFPNVEKI